MEFLNFTEFPHYVTGVYVVVSIGVLGLTAYILVNSQKQRARLKRLEKQAKNTAQNEK